MGTWFNPAALKAARLRAGLSQSALARAVGVQWGTRVSAWECGVDEPGPRMLPLLAEVLEIPVAALVQQDATPVGLRMMRKMAGLTLMEVSAESGIGYSRYRGIELGRLELKDDEVAALADLYGVDKADVRRGAEVTIKRSLP